MKRAVRWCVLFGLLWLASGCDVSLTLFHVPAQVAVGQVFEIRIDANITGSTGAAGCVLQMPADFTVVGAVNEQGISFSVDEASLLGTYAGEPGTRLWAAHHRSANLPGQPIVLQVFLRAPLGPTGSRTIKVALAGGDEGAWIAQSPPTTQFAAITAPPFAQPLTLVAAPSGDFTCDNSGLPVLPAAQPFNNIAVADVDGDGCDDLAASDGNGNVSTWLSRPHILPWEGGTDWTQRSIGPVLPPTANRLVFADLDRDGWQDILQGNRIFWGDGGTSWTPTTLPVPMSALAMGCAVGDIDHDGYLDVAISHPLGIVSVGLNNHDRTFRPANAGLPTAFTSLSYRNNTLVLADLTGDGKLDLLWARAQLPNVWLGDGSGGWTAANAPIPGEAHDAAVADLDRDGIVDVILDCSSSTSSLGLTVIHNLVGGTSFGSLPNSGLPTTGSYRGVAALDFDRDGFVDIAAGRGRDATATGNARFAAIELWRNDGLGHFSVNAASVGFDALVAGAEDLETCDFNGDTWPDLCAAIPSIGVFAFQNLRIGMSPFGAGCSGAGIGVPRLLAMGAPLRGNAAFAMQLQGGAANGLGAFWFDGQRRSAPPFELPLDLGFVGAPGCTLLANPSPLFLGVLDGTGAGTFPLPVPADPALAHLVVFGQGAANAVGANPFGIVFSAGLAIKLD